MTPEEQTLVQKGLSAQFLLDQDTFLDVVAGLMNHHHDAIAQTADTDAGSREEHFRKMRSFQNILAELQARSKQGVQIQQFYATEDLLALDSDEE